MITFIPEKISNACGKKDAWEKIIARFQDEGMTGAMEELNDSNIEECRNMTYTWIKMRAEKWNEEMELRCQCFMRHLTIEKNSGLSVESS